MSLDRLIQSWSEVRAGLIKEASQISDDKFSFRATPDTRSVAEILQHIIEAQKMLVGESCRPDTNLMRQSFAAHIKEYAPEVAAKLRRRLFAVAEATDYRHRCDVLIRKKFRSLTS
jgi:hypothetical protein